MCKLQCLLKSIFTANCFDDIILIYVGELGDDIIDTERTDVTQTGVAYRRRFAVAEISNSSVLQCSMQFDQAVQPTATLPELIDSPIPPVYTYTWSSPPIIIIGNYRQFVSDVFWILMNYS